MSSAHRSPTRHASRTMHDKPEERRSADKARHAKWPMTPSASAHAAAHRHGRKGESAHRSRSKPESRPSERRRGGTQPDASALFERGRLYQEAKELKRAREWQKRYYDLLSKYTHETAQRDAELADIHDLIEYMSWEQDRAGRLHHHHPLHTSVPAIAEMADAKPDAGVRDSRVEKKEQKEQQQQQQRSLPVQRETRGTSPAPMEGASAQSAEATGECNTKTGDGECSATAPSLWRTVQGEQSPTPHCASSGQDTDHASHSSRGDEGKDSVRGKEDAVGESAVDAAQSHRLSKVTGAAASPHPSAATAYVESLRDEAEAWRLRCLALLQQQQQQPPQQQPSVGHHPPAKQAPSSASQRVSSVVHEVLPEETPSFAAVPPPLPPRPPQRATDVCSPQTADYAAGLVTSFTNAAAPQAWESESEAEPLRSNGKTGTTGKSHDREQVYAGSELPCSSASSSTPTLSSLPHRPPQHIRRSVRYNEDRAGNDTNSSAPSSARKAGTAASGAPQLQQHTPRYAHQQHRYAPSPAALPSEATRRPPPHASAAALHALYLATEQRHVDLSPLSPSSHSPPRLSLFTGVPGYEPAAAARAHVTPPSFFGAPPQQPYNAVPERGGASFYDQAPVGGHSHVTPPRRTTAGGGEANGVWPPPPPPLQPQQQQFAPVLQYPPPPSLTSTWAGLTATATGNPLLHSSMQRQSASVAPSFSPYAPELFQSAPPSSSAAAAERVVAREQLERDIRRHDQLLAAIGKLQKTASEHASR